MDWIVGHFLEDEFFTGKVEIRLVVGFRFGILASRAVDAEEVIVTPQQTVAVSKQHSRNDRRSVQEAGRISQRLHKQLAVLNQ